MNEYNSVVSTAEFTVSPSLDHATSGIYLCYRLKLLSAFFFG